jgi:mannose-6-phosphate isomerase-like protein (cupin superfamily)
VRATANPGTVARVQSFEVAEAAARLRDRGGGYEVVHTSPGLEVGVYILVAPDEDKQVPHVLDEIYVVLDGDGEVEINGDRRTIRRGEGIFVPTGAEHRFHAYEELTLLVVFNGPHAASMTPH